MVLNLGLGENMSKGARMIVYQRPRRVRQDAGRKGLSQ